VPENLHGRELGTVFGSLYSPDLTPSGSLKDEVYKRNPHTLEVLVITIATEISAISGEELQRVNNVFRSHTGCIRSGRQQFQHLLLHLTKEQKQNFVIVSKKSVM
jgi:hypothetical protein